MASTDRFGHRADGKAPWERAQRNGYRGCAFYENIAYRFSSIGFRARELAESLVEGWKESPGHRRNMLQRASVPIEPSASQAMTSIVPIASPR